MSEFQESLDGIRQTAVSSGHFSVRPSDSLSAVISAAAVPACAGVYVISAATPTPRVIYIGKSGTVHQDGSLGEQRMNQRLRRKQSGLPREQFFREYMRGHSVPELHIEWFETYRENVGDPPFLVEARLLAAYLADHGALPELNRSA